MGQTDKNIRVHDRMSDQRRLAVLTVYDRYLDLIRSAQSVSDQNLTSGGNTIESVQVRTIQMLQRILSASRVKRITVSQKWFGVACCPPNIARTLASLGQYVYAENPEKRELYVNLFVSNETTLHWGNTHTGTYQRNL